MARIITGKSIEKRKFWVDKIHRLSENFVANFGLIENELEKEFKTSGNNRIVEHLRLCGNIPEYFGHNTSKEKLYSKYTDAVLSLAYRSIGIRSSVLKERANVADVEAYAKDYSFVADTKSFRLSRTAKNQKDFKIEALHRWKYGKPFAMIICPIYQLPSRNSQIYLQAINNNVCILTYSHLSLVVRYAHEIGKSDAEDLLHNVFKVVSSLNPSTSAIDYWKGINKTILGYSKYILRLWQDEEQAIAESIEISRMDDLHYLSSERDNIINMTREEAIQSIMKSSKIDKKVSTIKNLVDRELFSLK